MTLRPTCMFACIATCTALLHDKDNNVVQPNISSNKGGGHFFVHKIIICKMINEWDKCKNILIIEECRVKYRNKEAAKLARQGMIA